MLTCWLAFTRDVRRERTFTTHQIATQRDVYTSSLDPMDPEQAAEAPDSVPDKPPPARVMPQPAGGLTPGRMNSGGRRAPIPAAAGPYRPPRAHTGGRGPTRALVITQDG